MRILVGSDFGAASDEAVRQAITLARAERAELAVCHVLPEPQAHTLFPEEHERDIQVLAAIEPHTTAAIRAQVERFQTAQAITFDVFVEQGSAYAELVSRAEQWQAATPPSAYEHNLHLAEITRVMLAYYVSSMTLVIVG